MTTPQYRVETKEHARGYSYLIEEIATGRICADYSDDYDLARDMCQWANDRPGYYDPLPAPREPVCDLDIDDDGTIHIRTEYPPMEQQA